MTVGGGMGGRNTHTHIAKGIGWGIYNHTHAIIMQDRKVCYNACCIAAFIQCWERGTGTKTYEKMKTHFSNVGNENFNSEVLLLTDWQVLGAQALISFIDLVLLIWQNFKLIGACKILKIEQHFTVNPDHKNKMFKPLLTFSIYIT